MNYPLIRLSLLIVVVVALLFILGGQKKQTDLLISIDAKTK